MKDEIQLEQEMEGQPFNTKKEKTMKISIQITVDLGNASRTQANVCAATDQALETVMKAIAPDGAEASARCRTETFELDQRVRIDTTVVERQFIDTKEADWS